MATQIVSQRISGSNEFDAQNAQLACTMLRAMGETLEYNSPEATFHRYNDLRIFPKSGGFYAEESFPLDTRPVQQQRDEILRGCQSANVHDFATWQDLVTNEVATPYLMDKGSRLTKTECSACWALVATPSPSPLSAHQRIMQPDLTKLALDPSMYALEEHTGLSNKPNSYLITPLIAPCDCGDYFTEGFPLPKAAKHMSGGAGITQLERIIMEDCVMTAQGAPCLPHENKKPRPWFTNAGGIRTHYGITAEAATSLHDDFQIIGPAVAAKAYPELTPESLIALRILANSLRECEPTDADQTWINLDDGQDDPLGESQENILQFFDGDAALQEAVIPDDLEDVPSPVEYHLLDDPRDDAPSWESKQPAVYREFLQLLRTADYAAINKWRKNGKELTAKMTKAQRSIAWDTSLLRKIATTPAIPAKDQAIIDRCRLTPQIGKAKYWLHNVGKGCMTKFALSQAWDAVKAREIPAAAMPEPPPIEQNYDEFIYQYEG